MINKIRIFILEKDNDKNIFGNWCLIIRKAIKKVTRTILFRVKQSKDY